MSETTTALIIETKITGSLPKRGILLSKPSTSDISIASDSESYKSANISFAPLPTLEQRKRRNNRPIGVAGRAEMLRKSRRSAMQLEEEYYHNDYRRPQAEDEEIPLPDLGKMVKGLWRTIHRMKKDKRNPTAAPEAELTQEVSETTTIRVELEVDGEEGGVWTESIGSWADPALQNLKAGGEEGESNGHIEPTPPGENTPHVQIVP